MVFYITYIPHDIEKLHSLMHTFFINIYQKNIISFNIDLLPEWYLDTTNRMEKLELELAKFLRFDESVKSKIVEAFLACEDIESFFNADISSFTAHPIALDFRIIHDRKEDKSIENYLIDLFVNTLYVDQLSKKESTFSKKIVTNIGNHFTILRDEHSSTDEDFSLCPFCGIEPLKLLESEGRPDYDHLLPKGESLYVFSAINLKNLAPIGDHCNDKKKATNLLFTDKERKAKTIAFYPYSLPPNPFELYDMVLSCNEIPNNINKWKGKWNIEIIPKNPGDYITLEKIKTWDRVFNIKARYCEYIENHLKPMIEKILKTIDFSIGDLLAQIKTKLTLFLDNLYKCEYLFVATEDGLLPKRNLLLWFLGNDRFLLSYLEQKKKIPCGIDMTLME